MSVHDFPITSTSNKHGGESGIDKGGEPPDDGPMEARISKLEDFVVDARDRLTRIETSLEQTATKTDIANSRADLHDGLNGMIKWIVGTAIGLGAAGLTIMAFVLNNAIPKTPPNQPAQQQAPIIITIPQPAAVAAPAEPRKK